MRTSVTFRYPAAFLPLSDADDILAVGGARWFAALLARVPGLEVEKELCQEDWGVVLFARRDGKKFWIGLSQWDSEHRWLAHFHHGSFAWLQRFTSSGTSALRGLLADIHITLTTEPAVLDIAWYAEGEMTTAQPAGFPTPFDG
jgi:hypothetical protein